MKIFMFFINAIFWLWCFIVPAGLIGFLALYLYLKNPSLLVLSVILGLIGAVCGFLFAEFVRREYGLDNFFGRLHATPDIDGENILDKKDKADEQKAKKDSSSI